MCGETNMALRWSAKALYVLSYKHVAPPEQKLSEQKLSEQKLSEQNFRQVLQLTIANH